MAYPETIPTTHSVGDAGHTTDHNTMRTAISDIDVRVNAIEYPTITAKTTSYVLALADANTVITMSNAGATNITVPANGSVAFPIGTTITIINIGAGTPTIVPTSSNVKSLGNLFALSGTNATATLTKYATDLWNLAGGLS